VEGNLHFTVTNTLEPEGDGTRVTWRVDATPGLGGVFGRLADPLVEKAHARTVRGNLETLTEVLTEHQDAY
jgi:carbon monoxide dehydrogenase subunit G